MDKIPCGTPEAPHSKHELNPETLDCNRCGIGMYALALFHSRRNEEFPQEPFDHHYGGVKTSEYLLGDDPDRRCSWCFGVEHKHEAIFRVALLTDINGVPEMLTHELCWCCWFSLAFTVTPVNFEKVNTHGPSHVSRFRDCERRSFNRWQRLARKFNAWPREWVAGYFSGTPIRGEQDDSDRGGPVDLPDERSTPSGQG